MHLSLSAITLCKSAICFFIPRGLGVVEQRPDPFDGFRRGIYCHAFQFIGLDLPSGLRQLRFGTATATRTTRRTALRPRRNGADDPPPDGRLFRPGIRPAFRKSWPAARPTAMPWPRPVDRRRETPEYDWIRANASCGTGCRTATGRSPTSILYPAVELCRIASDAVPLLLPMPRANYCIAATTIGFAARSTRLTLPKPMPTPNSISTRSARSATTCSNRRRMRCRGPQRAAGGTVLGAGDRLFHHTPLLCLSRYGIRHP